jgi:hypothetical protein
MVEPSALSLTDWMDPWMPAPPWMVGDEADDPTAQVDRAVEKAAMVANAHNFVSKLPLKYDTQVFHFYVS